MQDAPSDPLFIPLQDSPEGAVRQAHSFSTERQSAKTPLVGETLVCDLLCIAWPLFLPVPSSAYSSAALPAYPKLPSGELKRGLVPPPFFLLCFAAVLPCVCTCLTRAGLLTENMGGKGEALEGPDALALLPLQLPSQRQNPLASTSSRTHESRLTRSGEGATRG